MVLFEKNQFGLKKRLLNFMPHIASFKYVKIIQTSYDFSGFNYKIRYKVNEIVPLETLNWNSSDIIRNKQPKKNHYFKIK